ncbi:hypothetical protein ONZ45_g5569 [Pleurotus djamor]|nr:hypothetical protein ONZ45_g5569 [Pleurotus djamor]
MSLARLLCIVVEVTGMWITSSPPNPPPSKQARLIPNWRETFLKQLAWPCVFLRIIFWLTAFTEAAAIISNIIFPSKTGHVFPLEMPFTAYATRFTLSPATLGVTLQSLFGTLTTFLGAMIRLSCYRTLGKHFTFELSLQCDHKLVKDGPYKYIRHPSYTGMIMTILGVICTYSSRGTWLRDSGILHYPFAWIVVAYWLTVAAAVTASLVLRLENEDDILRQAFGGEWIAWSEKVPYSLLPGIY